jgi:DegV family protein with EDD domain
MIHNKTYQMEKTIICSEGISITGALQVSPEHPGTRQVQTVAVVTDSVAQVPVEIAQQLDIAVIPFTVQICGKLYRDGLDLDLTELYSRMRLEKILPSTISPSPGEYLEVFRERLRAGFWVVQYTSLSSKLSSSYRNACLAADLLHEDYPQSKVEVFDSQTAASPEGFVAIAAARAAAQGKGLLEVQQAAREARRRSGLVATLETLEYLARGGRIGKAAFLMGNLIEIKPILTLDVNGDVSLIYKVRGTNHALRGMVDYVAQQVEGCQRLYLAIMEADASEQAARLRELAMQKLQPDQIWNSVFTPVMGAHTGPGLIGLGYYYE